MQTKQHLSASFFISMHKYCQAEKMAIERGELKQKKTDPMLIGGYVDSYFGGTFEQFRKDNESDLLTNKGALYAKFQHANTIIETAEADPYFINYLSGEKQYKVSGEIEGIEFIGYLDSFHPGKGIVELKVVKSIRETSWNNKTRQRENFIQSLGYMYQLAIYRELVLQQTGEKLPCYIAALSKENVPDKEVIYLPDWALDIAIDEVREYAENYYNIRRGIVAPIRCENCDYCRATRKLKEPLHYDKFCEQ